MVIHGRQVTTYRRGTFHRNLDGKPQQKPSAPFEWFPITRLPTYGYTSPELQSFQTSLRPYQQPECLFTLSIVPSARDLDAFTTAQINQCTLRGHGKQTEGTVFNNHGTEKLASLQAKSATTALQLRRAEFGTVAETN